jgi:hypothetical protein
MMMIRGAILFALLATTPVTVHAADSAKPAAAEKAGNKKVCRREVKTGSIMSRAVCRTQAEWDQLTAQGRNDFDRSRDMDRSRSMTGLSQN